MRKIASCALLLGLVVALVATGTAAAQAPKEPEVQATVYHIDPKTKKEVPVTGVVQEESITGIKMKVGKETLLIPALDVRQITYKTKLNDLDYRKAFSNATKANDATKTDKKLEFYRDALSDFKKLVDGVRDVPQAYRYINYKIAEVQVSIGLVDNAKLDDGIKALDTYRSEFARGWEVVPALKLLAETHELKGNLVEASKVYEELASLPDAPPEITRTASMLVTQMLLRGKKYAEAETKLRAVQQLVPKTDPQYGQITVMLCQTKLLQKKTAGVEADLRAALASSSDLYVHSVGHNCLGDLHLENKQQDEAFWEFLKVHLMYSQDRTEHARALYNLWKLFDKVKNDPIRAQECLDRLLTDKDYASTEWYTRAKAEAKPMTDLP